MISMNLTLGIILGLIILLMIIIVSLAITSFITKRYSFTGACIHIVFMMLVTLIFTIIVINSNYNRHYGGKRYNNVVDIHITSNGYYAELSDGRLIDARKVIYGEKTYIVEGTKLIEKCVLGIEFYTETNLLVVKPSTIDLDTMSESEKKHYLTNKYIELK